MEGWTAFAALVTAVLGAGGGALLLNWLKQRHDLRKAERGDAILEWKDYAAAMDERVRRCEEAQLAQRADHLKCLQENVEMRGELAALKAWKAKVEGVAGP